MKEELKISDLINRCYFRRDHSNTIERCYYIESMCIKYDPIEATFLLIKDGIISNILEGEDLRVKNVEQILKEHKLLFKKKTI